ncbi:M28 family peptidase [Billgrantia desiderata]|uniref:M28 family peptidase n=1 Tax=Billgrantia desiderata TaxID=52021 RepID=UPI00089F583F|nr:M28 family peptidase [Halomonas desiderata]SEF86656.1 Peptidase family M28 [Halomonas desiderata]
MKRRRSPLATVLGVIGCVFVLVLGGGYWLMLHMPGTSFHGAPPPLGAEGELLRERLQRHVRALSDDIGERHYWRPEALEAAADYIEGALAEAGHRPRRQEVPAGSRVFHNIEVVFPGADRADEVLVVGAHYDTVRGSPGADDNASGVAVLIELARLLQEAELDRSLRLVAFVNEEAPFFGSDAMGSLHYARQAKAEGWNVVGMISLEMLGYYSDEPDSQFYPFPLDLFYPDRGNFLAFVTHLGSRRLLHQAIGEFRRHATVPSEGLVAPPQMGDIHRSDHWAFWEMGFPAMMLTDTANFRNPHYHRPSDTHERLDYVTMARVAEALAHMLESMAQR